MKAQGTMPLSSSDLTRSSSDLTQEIPQFLSSAVEGTAPVGIGIWSRVARLDQLWCSPDTWFSVLKVCDAVRSKKQPIGLIYSYLRGPGHRRRRIHRVFSAVYERGGQPGAGTVADRHRSRFKIVKLRSGNILRASRRDLVKVAVRNFRVGTLRTIAVVVSIISVGGC